MKNRILPFLYTLLCCFWLTEATAKHIVGGEITYRVVSRTATSNLYEFTMKIYRDCNTNGGAQLDPAAAIGIYRGSNLFRTFSVPLGPVTRIDIPTIPCLIPPNVCVQEGVYVWQFELPIVSETYTIIYQRCCRNESINNIVDPGSFGASYTVEITGEGQRLGNNSPLFRQFPPIVICGNERLNFDHSATDAEGDQLIYEFCQPLSGGSQQGGTDCTGTAPNPPCWPVPVEPIRFQVPTYTFDKPLGGNPIVRIDPVTGRITGTPTDEGQFVVGVCVKEYRNGVLLGTIRRDFQFNVKGCQPTVKAKVEADSVAGDNYFIKSCGERNIAVNNLSLDRRFIQDFRFEVLIANQVRQFTEWQPVINFPDTGRYSGNLLLNPGTQCADTINLFFNVFPAAEPRFGYTYDTCVAGPVAFTDRSQSPGARISKWNWNFGDGQSATSRNPSHLYETPGQKNITLLVEDSRGCKNSLTQTINWQPVPPLLLIQPNAFAGCSPSKITFTNLSRPIDSTYNIVWNFGDGQTGSAISPTHTYERPGLYTVSLKVTSPIGCQTARTFPDLIDIKQGARADFTYSPERLSSFNNTLTINDNSAFTTQWRWFLDDRPFSTQRNPSLTVRDTGFHFLKLLASNQFNCSDTLIKRIDIEPIITYFLPNAFTPNDDGQNDTYKGTGYLVGLRDFRLRIWNRWGELIFETTDPNEGWNGTKFNTGVPAPLGVYMAVATFTTPRGKPEEIRSFAHLIR